MRLKNLTWLQLEKMKKKKRKKSAPFGQLRT